MRIVDHTLQQVMLVALVVMETVIVSLAIWQLYLTLAESVEAGLYRVHFQGGVDMMSELVREGMPVLGAMLALNFGALALADRLWSCYVKAIVAGLAELTGAAAALDLSARPPGRAGHLVLERAHQWRAAEAARLTQLRAALALLPATLPAAPHERAVLARRLAALCDD